MTSAKKIILFLFVLVLCKNGFTQQYQSMLGTSNEWYQENVGEGITETYRWQTTTDTVIGAYDYRKIEFFGTIQITNHSCEGFIREDTILKQIYYRNCDGSCSLVCDTNELLIYDFSKSPGDTVLVNIIVDFPTSPKSFILDSVKIDTAFSLNRIYYLHGINDVEWTVSWMEGVGSLTGFEDNLSTAGYSALLCAFKDSAETFHSLPQFPDSCIINLIAGIGDINAQFIKIYPNPTSSRIKIEITKASSFLQQISLFNIIGQELLSSYFSNRPQNAIIDVDSVPPGIYFCRVTFSNGEKGVKKVIIE